MPVTLNHVAKDKHKWLRASLFVPSLQGMWQCSLGCNHNYHRH